MPYVRKVIKWQSKRRKCGSRLWKKKVVQVWVPDAKEKGKA